MRITVVSGKGGVGKSMVSSAIITLFAKDYNVVGIDCDVDTPNLALWLGIDTSKKENSIEQYPISTIQKPVINKNNCKKCNKCISSCNFNSLKIDDDGYPELITYKCEGCGLCELICPHEAITLEDVENCIFSRYIINSKRNKNAVHLFEGQNKPGEAESGEVVSKIRKFAKEKVQELYGDHEVIYIQDGAAGIGCPVIASITGSDYVVVIAEPSMSSISNMNRVINVIDRFNISYGVVVNKFDLNSTLYTKIRNKYKNMFLGSVSYNKEIVEAISHLKPVIGNITETERELRLIFQEIQAKVSSI